MRSAQISFANKKVWIVGGGNQALKKGRQFIEEGANVIFVAPYFREEIRELAEEESCVLLENFYRAEDILGGFMIYACTDNRKVNHQIVLDGNEKGMLSGSVHKDAAASYHPLQFVDYPNLHVAVSTNGAAPAYNREILVEFHELYEATHREKLEKLRIEREARLGKR